MKGALVLAWALLLSTSKAAGSWHSRRLQQRPGYSNLLDAANNEAEVFGQLYKGLLDPWKVQQQQSDLDVQNLEASMSYNASGATAFFPSDESWQRVADYYCLSKEDLLQILADEPQLLAELMKYHLVNNVLRSQDFKEGMVLPTLLIEPNGKTMNHTLSRTKKNGKYKWGFKNASIFWDPVARSYEDVVIDPDRTNIRAGAGTVHVVNTMFRLNSTERLLQRQRQQVLSGAGMPVNSKSCPSAHSTTEQPVGNVGPSAKQPSTTQQPVTAPSPTAPPSTPGSNIAGVVIGAVGGAGGCCVLGFVLWKRFSGSSAKPVVSLQADRPFWAPRKPSARSSSRGVVAARTGSTASSQPSRMESTSDCRDPAAGMEHIGDMLRAPYDCSPEVQPVGFPRPEPNVAPCMSHVPAGLSRRRSHARKGRIDPQLVISFPDIDDLQPQQQDCQSGGKVYHGIWRQKGIIAEEWQPMEPCDDASGAASNSKGPVVQECEFLRTSRPARAGLGAEVGWRADLEHPNLVQFHGVCLVVDPPLLVMELCEHGSVFNTLKNAAHELANSGPETGSESKFVSILRWERRLAMLLDAAAGMSYLHNKGIVHGDLRSSNLFGAADGTVKVGGMQAPHQQRPKHGTAKYNMNPRWGAPEVMSQVGKRLRQHANMMTQASDVYSFGIIMHELLTFQVPFHGLAQEQVAHKVLAGIRPEIPSRDELPPGTSRGPALDAYISLMQRCWAQDASQRPSFEAIIEHLQAIQDMPGQSPKLPVHQQQQQQQQKQEQQEQQAWPPPMPASRALGEMGERAPSPASDGSTPQPTGPEAPQARGAASSVSEAKPHDVIGNKPSGSNTDGNASISTPDAAGAVGEAAASSTPPETAYQDMKALDSCVFGPSTWLATHSPSQQQLVILQLQGGALHRPDLQQQVLAASRLKHPNIMRVHEVFCSSTKSLCVVLDYCTGGSLLKYVLQQQQQKQQQQVSTEQQQQQQKQQPQQQEPWPSSEDQARCLFQQLVGAVEYCHAKGVTGLPIQHCLLQTAPGPQSCGGMHLILPCPLLWTSSSKPRSTAAGCIADIKACGELLLRLLGGTVEHSPGSAATAAGTTAPDAEVSYNLPDDRPSDECKDLLCKLLLPHPLEVIVSTGPIRQHPWFMQGSTATASASPATGTTAAVVAAAEPPSIQGQPQQGTAPPEQWNEEDARRIAAAVTEAQGAHWLQQECLYQQLSDMPDSIQVAAQPQQEQRAWTLGNYEVFDAQQGREHLWLYSLPILPRARRYQQQYGHRAHPQGQEQQQEPQASQQQQHAQQQQQQQQQKVASCPVPAKDHELLQQAWQQYAATAKQLPAELLQHLASIRYIHAVCLKPPLLLLSHKQHGTLARWLLQQQALAAKGSSVTAWVRNVPWPALLQVLHDVAAELLAMHKLPLVFGTVHAGVVLLLRPMNQQQHPEAKGGPRAALDVAGPWAHAVAPFSSSSLLLSAPELLVRLEGTKQTAQPSPMTDIYSFGMLMWSLAARWMPAQHTPGSMNQLDELQWCYNNLQQHKTTFPGALSSQQLSKQLSEHALTATDRQLLPGGYWQLLEKCCSTDPASRPPAQELRDCLASMVQQSQHTALGN